MTLRVESARKVFRPRRGPAVVALDGVDLEVGDELLVVVGPSGSGKSTLLRAIAGLEGLDGGSVVLDGRDVGRVSAGRREVALVFQEAALFPHLRVAANIGIGERARGGARAEVRQRVGEVAGMLDVEHLLERMPGELSGGERQRVALARAVIRSPRACLLDEPLASVDAESRLRLRSQIRAVQRSLGVPFVHVTHDQVEALAIGDRVAVMESGRVLQVGPAAEVYERPASTAVARRLGVLPMNLLEPGLVPARDGVVVGIRPERITVRVLPVEGRERSPAAEVAGEVGVVEPAGEECLVRVEIGGPGAPVEMLVRVRTDAAPPPGARVGLAWAADDEHHFDPRTGLRR
ncbi:MAG: ABC transporter ATP-binding protein [Dermatophilaceae bacterium]